MNASRWLLLEWLAGRHSELSVFMKTVADDAGSVLGWILSLTATNALPLESYSYCDSPLL